MDSAQIKSSLDRLFAKGARIVFWRDEDGEFEEMLSTLELDGVELRLVGGSPALVLKSELELTQQRHQQVY